MLIAWSRSDAGIADKDWRALLELPQHWIMPVFPIKAADFMKRGIEKGPALGAALAAAEAAWIAADFPADEKEVSAIADRADRRGQRLAGCWKTLSGYFGAREPKADLSEAGRYGELT